MLPASTGRRAATATLACALLVFACVNPLITAWTPVPDVSGTEGVIAVVGWGVAIVAGQRVTAMDGILALLAGWMLTSALINDVPVTAAGLEFALYAAPFLFLRLLDAVPSTSSAALRKAVKFLAVAQVAMFAFQLATYSGVDSLKGTFAGTQYGEHVASFIVLVTAAALALRRPGSPAAKAAVVSALALAYVADSKIAVMYFLLVGIVYLTWGASLPGRRSMRWPVRWLLGVLGITVTWMFYIGAFGNIALSGYVEQTTETGGGKLYVVNQIVDPGSQLWTGENMLVGAGPAQTVSRTAGLTVPNRSQRTAPAARVGLPPSRYYAVFERQASSYGYVAKSSATKAASSGLGLIGDLGAGGLALYGVAFAAAYRWIGRRLGYRSWPALAWLGLLVPGFLGEWLEFPPAGMFLLAVAAYLAAPVRSSDAQMDSRGATLGVHGRRKCRRERARHAGHAVPVAGRRSGAEVRADDLLPGSVLQHRDLR